MHCSGMADVMLSEQAEASAEPLEGDQVRLPRFKRGEFTVADRDLNEVPPYQNDAFMSRVRDLAFFDTVRAAQPADKGATSTRAQGRDWAAGEHPGVSKQHKAAFSGANGPLPSFIKLQKPTCAQCVNMFYEGM